MNKRLVLVTLGLLTVLSMVLAACSPATPAATEPPATAAPATEAPTEVPPTATEPPAPTLGTADNPLSWPWLLPPPPMS